MGYGGSLAATRDLDTLFRAGALGGLTDGQLLERFARGDAAGEAAFEALVGRHGAMVARVCRGTLDDDHDAQDAAQATFLVLARRAGSIRRRESVASWLFGVAARVSARARVDAARRRRLERHAAAPSTRSQADDPDDLAPVLRAEVARLPEKYRAPVVLCYLEGLTCAAAAGRLGCPVGTVKVRLSRARDLLRTRLTRRGLALPAALAAAGLSARPASAAPAALLGATTARAAMLASGALRLMLLDSLKWAATAALAIGVTAAGIGALARQDRGVAPAPTPPPTDHAAAAEARATSEARAIRMAVDRVVKTAEGMADPAERAEALLRLGTAEIRRGEREAARETLRRAAEAADAIKPADRFVSPHPLMRIAKAQAQAGDPAAHRTFEKMVRFIEAMEDFQGYSQWINLLPTQVEAEGRDASKETFRHYRQFLATTAMMTPDGATTQLVGSLALEGDIDGALLMVRGSSAFRGPAKEENRRSAWLSLVAGLRPEDRAVAGPILLEARRAIDADPIPVMKAQDLARLATSLATLGKFAEASAAAEAIDPATVQDLHLSMVKFQKALAYIAIGTEQLKAGDRVGASKSALAALAVADSIGELSSRIYPREQAAELLIKGSDLVAARRVVDTLEPRGRTYYLMELATAQQQAGDAAGAEATLRRALDDARAQLRDQAARPPAAGQGEQPESIASGIALVEARLGDFPEAMRTLDSIKDDKRKDHALRMMAAIRARSGDVPAALGLVDKITSPQLKTQGLIDVVTMVPARRPTQGRPAPKTP